VPTIESVYIIYHADVISPRESDIEGMAPASHVPKSIGGAEPEAAKRIAEAFTETEGDDSYDYGYLGDESNDPRYYPLGYIDREGFDKPFQVRVKTEDGDELLPSLAPSIEVAMESMQDRGYEVLDAIEDEDRPVGMGRHRKWVGELSREDWFVFARAYSIEVDDDGLPTQYEDTMGSITAEYGHIPAVSIDNSEGWDYPGFGYGSVESVLDSRMYVSIALKEGANA
jgi:hypothetical protein